MNFKDLDKETKQKLILAGMFLAGLIYVAINFGISPLMSRVTQMEEETSELEQKIFTTRRALKQERVNRNTKQRLGEDITLIAARHIPSEASPLSWVSGHLNTAARKAGVTLQMVEGERGRNAANTGRTFRTFGVRVSFEGSYFDLIRFLSYLEQENPYVAVTDLNIRAVQSTPEIQKLYLLLEWPMWENSSDKEKLSS